MANITTRETAGTNCTINGAPLTNSQMDNDLIALNNDITTLQGYYVSGVERVLNGGTGVTTSTGSGSVVLNTSPTLVTPALGTPSSGTLTNCTFPTLNQNTSGSAATLSATLAVNKGGTGVTTSTGSGSTVLSNSPTLVTPALGTPSSGVVTNLSGTASININGTVGATTPNTGSFTKSTFSGANSTTDGAGQIYLNGANGNRIDFNVNGTAEPTYTTRSAGTKICLYPLVSPTLVDFAIGIGPDDLWTSVSDSSQYFTWFAGTDNIGSLSGTGVLWTSNNISAGTGYLCKAGISSTTYGHQYNTWWTGTNLQAWVADVNIGNFTITSDYRIKENINPQTENAIERIKLLNPITFNRKNIDIFTDDGILHEGFIAHELKEVIPSAVSGEKDALTISGGIQPQTLELTPILSVVVKALQEQQVIIDALKLQVESLMSNK